MPEKSFKDPIPAYLHLRSLAKMPFLRFVSLDHHKLETTIYNGRKAQEEAGP